MQFMMCDNIYIRQALCTQIIKGRHVGKDIREQQIDKASPEAFQFTDTVSTHLENIVLVNLLN